MRKALPFCLVLFCLHHAYIEKIPVPGQALPRYIFVFQESLGMRLSFWGLWKAHAYYQETHFLDYYYLIVLRVR